MLRVFSRSLVVPDLVGRNRPIHYSEQAPSGLVRHFICVLSLLVLTTVAAATVSGQTQPRSGRSGTRPQLFEILGISVEGNSVAEPAAIIANAGLKISDELAIPGDQSAEAIRRLWALRIFSDVQILVERTVGTGVYLLIHVTEFPRLERIEIEGEDEVSEKDILKKVNLIKGQILTPQGMNRIVKDVKKLYEEKGF
ncbi:MAG: POTRA domain-containing protein, partial [Bacteroidota bacterium]